MKDSPERQALEKALEHEPVGSPKILALAHYAELEDVEYKLKYRSRSQTEFVIMEWHVRKAVIEQTIHQQHYTKDAAEYMDAFENADVILTPYYEKYNGYPGEVLLDDLREINREKSRK